MSATNRGTERKESDFYATPLECINTFLSNYKDISESDLILEPSAGNGNIVKALRDNGFKNDITALELRECEVNNLRNAGADTVITTDFLTLSEDQKYDVIIGNPPYSIAQEFIEKSFRLLKPGGRLIFLLRTNFLESKRRYEFWQKYIVTGLYVLSKRPSFTGKGTDATSYSWFVWRKTDRQTDRQTDNKSYLGEAFY